MDPSSVYFVTHQVSTKTFISSHGQSSGASSRHCLNDVSYSMAVVSVASAAKSLIRLPYWKSLEPSSGCGSKLMIPNVKNEDIHCCRWHFDNINSAILQLEPFFGISVVAAQMSVVDILLIGNFFDQFLVDTQSDGVILCCDLLVEHSRGGGITLCKIC